MLRALMLILPLTLPGLCAADEDLGRDLGATIALHGQPCGKVVSATRNADSDYVATCENGARYHVYVDAGGRVVVQKL